LEAAPVNSEPFQPGTCRGVEAEPQGEIDGTQVRSASSMLGRLLLSVILLPS